MNYPSLTGFEMFALISPLYALQVHAEVLCNGKAIIGFCVGPDELYALIMTG